MLHDFEYSKRTEQKWAPRLDEALMESSYFFRVATADEQWRGIDRVVTSSRPIGVEYKCDERAQHTGNFFFETVSNATTGRAGCVLTSEAQWLLYFVVPDRVFVFWLPTLRASMPGWRLRYPERAATNIREGVLYDTLGLCVPLAIGAAVAESLSSLTHGDAIILERRDEEEPA